MRNYIVTILFAGVLISFITNLFLLIEKNNIQRQLEKKNISELNMKNDLNNLSYYRPKEIMSEGLIFPSKTILTIVR